MRSWNLVEDFVTLGDFAFNFKELQHNIGLDAKKTEEVAKCTSGTGKLW
jgi:hypothetical protein